jgi:hypothetical protein
MALPDTEAIVVPASYGTETAYWRVRASPHDDAVSCHEDGPKIARRSAHLARISLGIMQSCTMTDRPAVSVSTTALATIE